MTPESNKHQTTLSQKNLDQDIRELISSLTNRLSTIQRGHKLGPSSSTHEQTEEDNGNGIITLAGSNVGATMRGEMDEKPAVNGLKTQDEDFTTYVNSNFQGINNSIMFGGSYTTNDPGVHLDITDYFERKTTRPKRVNKGKMAERQSSSSDQQGEKSE